MGEFDLRRGGFPPARSLRKAGVVGGDIVVAARADRRSIPVPAGRHAAAVLASISIPVAISALAAPVVAAAIASRHASIDLGRIVIAVGTYGGAVLIPLRRKLGRRPVLGRGEACRCGKEGECQQ